jgi:nitroimidazol reductase NimA-like FMN-containing flavoprotein (pyridoxamine 5'-phosphate oxidase superfamily)
MTTTAASTSIEYLAPDECWRLLASTPVGRIGVLADSAPEIYPVNHAVDGRTLVFRTAPGTKLRSLLRTPLVCFEVDGIDADAATGWSVLVKGRAAQIVAPDEIRAAQQLQLLFWPLGQTAHWIRVVPDQVTGRRIWSHVPARPGA